MRHIVGGELLWIGFRMVLISTVFLGCSPLFADPALAAGRCSPSRPRCSPGVAFSAAIISFAATQKNDAGFAALFRFVINPLFLFSGTFFPLTQLPASAAQWIAAATPLYHGVALIRGLILNDAALLAGWYWHVGYLVAFAAFFARGSRIGCCSRRLVK